MANFLWRGGAPVISQVNQIMVDGTPMEGQTYAVTVNGKTMRYTAIKGDTNSSIAAALQALLAECPLPEFREVAWTFDANVLTATARTAGKPFTCHSKAVGEGLLATTTVTANSSPADWNTPANWNGGSVPTDAGSVFLRGPDSQTGDERKDPGGKGEENPFYT